MMRHLLPQQAAKAQVLRGVRGFLLVLLTLFTASCRREPLYDEIGLLRLDIEIDYNIKHTPSFPEPTMMYVGLYDTNTGKLLRTEFTGPRGGEIYANPGVYDFLIYNFDTEATNIRNNQNIHAAEAYTNIVPYQVAQTYQAMIHKIKEKIRQMELAQSNIPVKSRITEYEDQPLINEPDHLFVGTSPHETIPVRDNLSEILVIHSQASTLLETYALTIGPIKGMEYIASAEAFITGQAPSKLLASRQITGVPSVLYVPFDIASRRMRSTMLNTTFNTFGKYPGVESKVILVVKIVDLDGNITVVETDVTDQFENPANSDHDIVIDQEIEIQPPSGDGGFSPEVTIWHDCVTNITL